MAASPKYKVFTPLGEYVASCKHAEDAAAVVAAHGEGAEIRTAHSSRAVVFRESESLGDDAAANSYDRAADIVFKNEVLPFASRSLASKLPANLA